MKIEARGVISDPTERGPEELIACFASLCLSRSGTLFSVFQAGLSKNAPHSTLRLCRSRDAGQSWHASGWRFETTQEGIPGSLSNGELVELDDGRLLLVSTWIDRRDPARPLFDPATEGLLPMRLLKAFSADEGETWSDWETIPLTTAGWCYHSSGPLLRCDDGTLVLVAESHKSIDGTGPSAAAEASWFLISVDQGTSFQGPHPVCQHPEHRLFYWDARLAPGPRPGTWLACYWTHDPQAQRDLPVHGQLGTLVRGQVEPGPAVNTGIPGQITAPLCLSERHWLAVTVNRAQPGTITVWESRDGGATWNEAVTVYTHADRHLERGTSAADLSAIWEEIARWGFGHPAIRRLNADQVLVTWYAGTAEGMRIEWARLRLDDKS